MRKTHASVPYTFRYRPYFSSAATGVSVPRLHMALTFCWLYANILVASAVSASLSMTNRSTSS